MASAHEGFDLHNADPRRGPVTPLQAYHVAHGVTVEEFEAFAAQDLGLRTNPRLHFIAPCANKTIRPEVAVRNDCFKARFGPLFYAFVGEASRNVSSSSPAYFESMIRVTNRRVEKIAVSDKGEHILIFLKRFDRLSQTIAWVSALEAAKPAVTPLFVLSYDGHLVVAVQQQIEDVVKWRAANRGPGPFRLHEEVKPGLIELLSETQKTLKAAELDSGDILCHEIDHARGLPTVQDYFGDLVQRMGGFP
ncbi:hypothetical protein DFJ74DRAFT_678906 [Hyaloraphidium curvatum]|nr:hypothetical protein DFJ74DRAFT_678906 [Hyaloraphidium curvatum]